MTAILTARDEAQVSNGAAEAIDLTIPYRVAVTVEGAAPLLFHAWNTESVAEKAAAAKNSAAKKTDNVESYAYRNEDGHLGIPGKNFHAALVNAGRWLQDPRSPRKSAMDLVRAGIVPLTILCPFQPLTQTWDYLDAQRVTIQRAGVTRTRPAMKQGWRVTFDIMVNIPEYINPTMLNELIGKAGRFSGLCDFRPTYGRFNVVGFVVDPL